MLLLDVEDPGWLARTGSEDRRARRAPNRVLPAARRFDLLAVREYAPPDHGQEGEEPRLLLMGSSLAEVGGDVVGPVLREAVTAVYRYRYGLGPDHPVVRTTLRASGL
ncbi:MAG: hypothetical protein V9G09_02810 [Candidatus Nanopelagicales bacterium]